MPTTQTTTRKLVILETAIQEIEVSEATIQADADFEMAPNPNISNE